MNQPYLAFLLLLGFVAFNAALLIGLSHLLAPHKPTAIKDSPYESGMPPLGNARERFSVKFYLVAMLFIIFDIETVFLIPWGTIYFGGATRSEEHTSELQSRFDLVCRLLLLLLPTSTLFPYTTLFRSHLLAPHKPTAIKDSPYESGMPPLGNARERFSVKFYLVAMLFIIFDIETVFLIPWGTIYFGGAT